MIKFACPISVVKFNLDFCQDMICRRNKKHHSVLISVVEEIQRGQTLLQVLHSKGLAWILPWINEVLLI